LKTSTHSLASNDSILELSYTSQSSSASLDRSRAFPFTKKLQGHSSLVVLARVALVSGHHLHVFGREYAYRRESSYLIFSLSLPGLHWSEAAAGSICAAVATSPQTASAQIPAAPRPWPAPQPPYPSLPPGQGPHKHPPHTSHPHPPPAVPRPPSPHPRHRLSCPLPSEADSAAL